MNERTRPMTPAEIQAQLPKVGDRRMERPTIDETRAANLAKRNTLPCTVIEVNRVRLWYRVRFDNGFTECYKLPKGTTGGAWE